MKDIIEEECPKCEDGIFKAHEIIGNKLKCLTCGNLQEYEMLN